MTEFEQRAVEALTQIRDMLEQYHQDLCRAVPRLQPGSACGAAEVVEAVVLTFPTVGVNGSTWALTSTLLAEWAPLFPGLDVEIECRHALAWVQAQPTRRKSISGMPRFLVGWLTRAQNGGRPAAPPSPGPAAGSLTAGEAKEFEDYYRRMLGSYCPHDDPPCEDRTTCKRRQREAWVQARRGG